MLQVSNSVLPVTCPHKATERGTQSFSWKILTCGWTTTVLVPTALEVQDVQKSLLIMHSFRFHGLVLIEQVVVLTKMGIFLCLEVAGFSVKVGLLWVILQTNALMRNLRFLQQYWWRVKSSRDVTPCRLVNSYPRVGLWCWCRLQGLLRVRVGQRHVGLSLRINAVLHPRRYESAKRSPMYAYRNNVALSRNQCCSGNATVDFVSPAHILS